MSWDNYLTAADIGLDFVCGRCLAIVNAATHVQAVRHVGDIIETEVYPHPTDVIRLRVWAANRIAEGSVIQMDNLTEVFEPVSTWQGDPVCGWHLMECVQAERSGPYGHGRAGGYPR